MLTNFTRVLQAISSRLNCLISFNGLEPITPLADKHYSLDSESDIENDFLLLERSVANNFFFQTFLYSDDLCQTICF